MIEEDFVENTVMPPRSRLYSLPLYGHGGRDREALLDYSQRLSAEHCLKVKHLFASVVLPVAELPGVLSARGYFSEKHLRTCNGCSNYASKFVRAMEQLTGRTDLAAGTFLPWAGAFGYHATALLAPTRRWCPHCIEEQLARGLVRHYLLWAIDAAQFCPEHRVRLQAHCAACGRTQPSIHDALALAKCSSCGTTMARPSTETARTTVPSDRETYMVNSVAELIGASERAGWFARPEFIVRRYQEVADVLTDGSTGRLERALGLSKRVMRHVSPKSLKMFLEITYRLGLTPLEFLERTKTPSLNPARSAERFATHRRKAFKADPEVRRRIEVTLKQVTTDESKFTTTKDFCERVGVTTAVLNNQFPEVARALTEYKCRVRPMFQAKRKKEALANVDAAMTELVAVGGPFTSRGIDKALAKFGLSRRHPEIRKIAYTRLAEIRQRAVLDGSGASKGQGYG